MTSEAQYNYGDGCQGSNPQQPCPPSQQSCTPQQSCTDSTESCSTPQQTQVSVSTPLSSNNASEINLNLSSYDVAKTSYDVTNIAHRKLMLDQALVRNHQPEVNHLIQNHPAVGSHFQGGNQLSQTASLPINTRGDYNADYYVTTTTVSSLLNVLSVKKNMT